MTTWEFVAILDQFALTAVFILFIYLFIYFFFFFAGPSLVFPQELLSYGLSEEVLTASFQQVCAGEPVGWKLTCIPTIGFCKALHRFLKQWPLSSKVTKCKIAEFYMAIDAKLRAKGGRPDNIYRFIENLMKAKASSKLMCYETPEQKIRRLKSNIGHCNKQLEEVTSEYMELKGQFQESKCKLQGTQKVLQDVTNQRDTLKRSKDFLNYQSVKESMNLFKRSLLWYTWKMLI